MYKNKRDYGGLIMEINIEDYINESEMKRIVENEFRDRIRRYFLENKLSDLIYSLCNKEICKVIEEEIPNFKKEIKTAIPSKIKDINKFDIFKSKDDFINSKDSIGQQILEETIEENKDMLEQKVKNIFSELSKGDIADEIAGIVIDKIDNMFRGDK